MRVSEEVDQLAGQLEDAAKLAMLYAANNGEFEAMRGFDDIRKAAKSMRRPEPTPIPRKLER